MLSLDFRYTYIDKNSVQENPGYGGQNGENASKSYTQKMYYFSNKPDDFLKSRNWCDAVAHICDRLLQLENDQEEIDHIYTDLCRNLFGEMDQFLEYKKASTNTKKQLKLSKPYWNSALSQLWRQMKNAEKRYVKFEGSNVNMHRQLRQEFKDAQKNFDKSLRAAARK